jgi:hypothetical protein
LIPVLELIGKVPGYASQAAIGWWRTKIVDQLGVCADGDQLNADDPGKYSLPH